MIKNIIIKIISVVLIAGMVLHPIVAFAADGDKVKPQKAVETFYPELQKLADKGLIGLKVEAQESITFGNWSEDGDDNPLEWLVLDYSKDGKKALVISKYLLCAMAYNESGKKTTWADCSLREWLNNDFYKEAFSADERKLIKKTSLTNPDNSEYKTKGGEKTNDKIFVLSPSEVKKYFKESDDSKHAYTRMACYPDGQIGGWWLRAPGHDKKCAVTVDDMGNVFNYGWDVENDFEFDVRPAFWIELTEDMVDEFNLSAGKNSKNKGLASEGDITITLGKFDMQWHGSYYYGKTTIQSDGKKEDIEWKVIDYDPENNRALLLSKYILAHHSYNDKHEFSTWENCSARKWLNNSFYKNAFTEKEKSLILKTKIKNEDNDEYGTDGGNSTKDRLFLLSLSEVDKYLTSENRESMNYYRVASLIDNEHIWWWLRSPGKKNSYGALISYDGYVKVEGDKIDKYDNDFPGIRPAMWISLEP